MASYIQVDAFLVNGMPQVGGRNGLQKGPESGGPRITSKR